MRDCAAALVQQARAEAPASAAGLVLPVPGVRAIVDRLCIDGQRALVNVIDCHALTDSLLHVMPQRASSADATAMFSMHEEVGRAAMELELATFISPIVRAKDSVCADRRTYFRAAGTAADAKRILATTFTDNPVPFLRNVYAELFLNPRTGITLPVRRLDPNDDDSTKLCAATVLAMIGEAINNDRARIGVENDRMKLRTFREATMAIARVAVFDTLRQRLPTTFGADWTQKVLYVSPEMLLRAAIRRTRPDLDIDDLFERHTIVASGLMHCASAESRAPLFAAVFPHAQEQKLCGCDETPAKAVDACAFAWLRVLEAAGHFHLPRAIAFAAPAPKEQSPFAVVPALESTLSRPPVWVAQSRPDGSLTEWVRLDFHTS